MGNQNVFQRRGKTIDFLLSLNKVNTCKQFRTFALDFGIYETGFVEVSFVELKKTHRKR